MYFVLFKSNHANLSSPIKKSSNSNLRVGQVIGEEDDKLKIRSIILAGWRYLNYDDDFYFSWDDLTQDHFALVDKKWAKPLKFFNKSVLLNVVKSTPRLNISAKLTKSVLLDALDYELSLIFRNVELRTTARKEEIKKRKDEAKRLAEIIDHFDIDDLKCLITKSYDMLSENQRVLVNRCITMIGTQKFGSFCPKLPLTMRFLEQ